MTHYRHYMSTEQGRANADLFQEWMCDQNGERKKTVERWSEQLQKAIYNFGPISSDELLSQIFIKVHAHYKTNRSK